MRYLYLDDSGKIHKNDPAKFFVLAGFSIEEGQWHKFTRQVNGAKSNFLPTNGKPYDWEIKSTDFLTANAWKRAKRRNLCHQVVQILGRLGCRVYAASLEKCKAKDALDETKFFPLAFQRLIAKFNSEIISKADTGSIVCDWSTYKMDHHISQCVTSMVITNKMEFLRGGVTYGSSSALPTLQVADLIGGATRRALEGQGHMDALARDLRELRYTDPGGLDVLGHPVDSILRLF